MKRLIFDLDGTLTIDQVTTDYSNKLPKIEMISRLREYKALGFQIIIMTARNMRTHNNSVGLINAKTLPIIIEWLNRHEVPYDEIHVGKPWCGTEGFYIDDKAIRPDEFINLSYEEIRQLISLDGNDGI
jgi:capsule biosynthesis phosphatase